ncbi:MAG: hypothetical protein VB878_01500 [Pirellulaceae bacterium]
MELQHVNIKIFVDGDLRVDLQQVVDVFHRWIAEQAMDELLIDVADYRHVPAGPGVVIVGHEADYSLDNAGNRHGLLYNRKMPISGSNADRFNQAFAAAVKACNLLENEFAGKLRFNRQEFELLVNDRCLAPNTVETLEACKPEIEAFLDSLGQTNAVIAHDTNGRRRFSVNVALNGPLDFGVVLSS